MSLRNRRSPSGPSTEVQLPIYGSSALAASLTQYLLVGSVGVPSPSPAESPGQFAIPQSGMLTSAEFQNTTVGLAGSTTYNVRKNGVLITTESGAPATVTIDNTSQEPVELPINIPVKGPAPAVVAPPTPVTVADLISIQAVTGAAATQPVVRVTLKYAPGGPF
jgi:hypothetical protein